MLLLYQLLNQGAEVQFTNLCYQILRTQEGRSDRELHLISFSHRLDCLLFTPETARTTE